MVRMAAAFGIAAQHVAVFANQRLPCPEGSNLAFDIASSVSPQPGRCGGPITQKRIHAI